MFTFISNNGLYDDGKKMTKNDSADHISENDGTTRVIMGWLAATPLWPILNQIGTENIGNFNLYSLFKKRCKHFDIFDQFSRFLKLKHADCTKVKQLKNCQNWSTFSKNF